jgi:hypothetical protein
VNGKVPDHSTFSKNRHCRFRESDLLRHVFESVVQRCMAEGLVGTYGLAVQSGLIDADANKQHSVASKDWKLEEIKGSRRSFRSSTSPIGRTVRSPEPTSPWIPNATVTCALQARNWFSFGAPTQPHEAASRAYA